MDERSDLDLIRALREADASARESAFAILYARHVDRAHRLAFRVLGDSELAADAVQEAFLTVYRKGARFEERAQFTSWLFRVVLNRAIDLRRRGRRGPAGLRRATGGGSDPEGAGGADPLADAPDRGPGPEAAARAAERAELVRTAVDRLSPKLAEIVLLRYPEGLDYAEIGEILGLPPGTVRSRLNRAHAALRAILGPHLDDERGSAGAGGAPPDEAGDEPGESGIP